jgi:hypothetical protein
MKQIFPARVVLALISVIGFANHCVSEAKSAGASQDSPPSGQVQAPSAPVPSAIPHYPNSQGGLEDLMRDMISLQRREDSAALASYFQSLILPDPEAWFSSGFGDADCDAQDLGPNGCLGPRIAWYYTATAKTLPDSFALTLADLVHENLTNFESVNQTEQCAGPVQIIPSQKLIGEFTTVPVLLSPWSKLVRQNEPVYVLWAFNESKETTLSFFVYSQGAFRYIGMPRPAPADDYRQKKYSEGSFPPLSAHYLTNEQLAMDHVSIAADVIRETVVVLVIVGRDGKPRDVSYVRGDETLKNAAIQTVRKQRFEPPGFGPHGLHPDRFCTNVRVRR